MLRVVVLAASIAVVACNGNGAGAIFAWSDDGSCGVPIGYVGVGETISDAGACQATMWCPADASPVCVKPVSINDASGGADGPSAADGE